MEIDGKCWRSLCHVAMDGVGHTNGVAVSAGLHMRQSVGGEACMGAGARPEAASDITWQAIGLFVGAEWMEMAIWGCEVDRES